MAFFVFYHEGFPDLEEQVRSIFSESEPHAHVFRDAEGRRALDEHICAVDQGSYIGSQCPIFNVYLVDHIMEGNKNGHAVEEVADLTNRYSREERKKLFFRLVPILVFETTSARADWQRSSPWKDVGLQLPVEFHILNSYCDKNDRRIPYHPKELNSQILNLILALEKDAKLIDDLSRDGDCWIPFSNAVMFLRAYAVKAEIPKAFSSIEKLMFSGPSSEHSYEGRAFPSPTEQNDYENATKVFIYRSRIRERLLENLTKNVSADYEASFYARYDRDFSRFFTQSISDRAKEESETLLKSSLRRIGDYDFFENGLGRWIEELQIGIQELPSLSDVYESAKGKLKEGFLSPLASKMEILGRKARNSLRTIGIMAIAGAGLLIAVLKIKYLTIGDFLAGLLILAMIGAYSYLMFVLEAKRTNRFIEEGEALNRIMSEINDFRSSVLRGEVAKHILLFLSSFNAFVELAHKIMKEEGNRGVVLSSTAFMELIDTPIGNEEVGDIAEHFSQEISLHILKVWQEGEEQFRDYVKTIRMQIADSISQKTERDAINRVAQYLNDHRNLRRIIDSHGLNRNLTDEEETRHASKSVEKRFLFASRDMILPSVLSAGHEYRKLETSRCLILMELINANCLSVTAE